MAILWVEGVESVASFNRAVSNRSIHMLHYALIFFVVALIAAVFGFGGIASASAGIAQILFVIFLVLFVATLIVRALRG